MKSKLLCEPYYELSISALYLLRLLWHVNKSEAAQSCLKVFYEIDFLGNSQGNFEGREGGPRMFDVSDIIKKWILQMLDGVRPFVIG